MSNSASFLFFYLFIVFHQFALFENWRKCLKEQVKCVVFLTKEIVFKSLSIPYFNGKIVIKFVVVLRNATNRLDKLVNELDKEVKMDSEVATGALNQSDITR